MKKIIFISSSGRSGSKSIASTLNNVDNVKAFHSPFNFENYNCCKYLSQLEEVKKQRKKLIESVINNNYNYIESAVCIRYCIEDLVKLYPECTIVHLVRDGRDFVRSGLNRPWFKGNVNNRFNKICKLWAEGQRMTIKSMKKIPKKNYGGVIKLEDLSGKNINWFIEKIGLKSKNPTMMLALHTAKNYNFPQWVEWNSTLINRAKILMGKELKYFGYKWY